MGLPFLTNFCIIVIKRILHILLAGLLFTLPSFGGELKVFTPEQFGARADGRTDNKAAFLALSKAVNSNGGGRVVFPKGGTYLVRFEDDPGGGHTKAPSSGAIGLNFRHCDSVFLEMNGSTIIVAPNHSTQYAVVRFFDCRNFKISGGVFVGDNRSHDYSATTYNGRRETRSHEWGCGIINSGSKGEISSMNISQMTGDGIYTGSIESYGVAYRAKTIVDSCEIFDCRRNGISVSSSEGFTLRSSKIHHIGSWNSVKGTAPMAGIDFEFEDKLFVRGSIILEDSEIYACSSKCLVAASTFSPVVDKFIARGCRFSSSTVFLHNMTCNDGMEISSCSFDNCRFYFGNAVVRNCSFTDTRKNSYVDGGVFENCSFSASSNVLSCYRKRPVTFQSCTFDGCRPPAKSKIL